MANDLAGLNAKLALAIGEAYVSNDTVWASAEIDEIVTETVNMLYPRFAREFDPTTALITVVAGTYFYSLPSGVKDVSRIDFVDPSGVPNGPLFGRAWELVGNVLAGTGKLHIGAAVNDSINGYSLQLHCYGAYDVTTNLIPDILIGLVIARGRVEAYRRVSADRMRFKAWLARNQVQNISINEMLQTIRDADQEAARLERTLPRTWRLPVSGRVG